MRKVLPDVSLFSFGPNPGGSAVENSPVEIVDLSDEIDEIHQSFMEVRDRHDRSLIAVVELVSPANKSGDDHDAYRSNRAKLLKSGVNVVEIDLHRGGRRTVNNLGPCDYYTMVCRAEDGPRGRVTRLNLHDRLPVISIPLRPGEPEPTVDLQKELDSKYDDASYGIDVYLRDPVPPLTPEQAAWASQFLPKPASPPAP